jgi:hypothetical protein
LPAAPVSLTLQPPEAGSAWQAVEVSGEARAVFDAYDRCARVVDEVDDCVLSLPVPVERRAALVGGSTLAVWKRISALSGARVHMPAADEGEVAAATLEGPITAVKTAFGLLFDVLAQLAATRGEERFHVAGAWRAAGASVAR